MAFAPLYVFTPDSVSVPASAFVNPPAPEITLDTVVSPAPPIVKVPALTIPVVPIVSVWPPVVTSISPLVALTVKPRSVLAVTPVYERVPPSRTRFVAAAAAWPRLPAAPPLPIVPTLTAPAVIVVTPV